MGARIAALRLARKPGTALLPYSLLVSAVTACGFGAAPPDLASHGTGPTAVSVVVQNSPDQPFVGSVAIEGLSATLLHRLAHDPAAGGNPVEADTRGTIAVFSSWAVETHGDEALPLPGRFLVETDRLRFVPRFPLHPGMTYRLRIGPGAADGDSELWLAFEVPGSPAATTRVESIYPGSTLLPENLHRITVSFSAPMSHGESRSYIRLERESGEVVERPFLEAELWNRDGDRLTLLLNASSRGNRAPRTASRTTIREGERLRLVIASGWPDFDGLPLVEGAEKAFVVVAPDHVAPDPAVWTLEVPAGSTRSEVRLFFPEPLDRVLLESAIGVRGELGIPVPGTVEIGAEERSWSFEPQSPWSPGLYRLEIEPILEDLAGNNLQGLFDIEIGVATPESRRDMVRLLFDVGSGDAAAAGTGAPHPDGAPVRPPRPSG